MKTIFFSVLLTLFFSASQQTLSAQNKADEKVSADVSCDSIGTLNGDVIYRYDATLKNNTSSKLKVEYTVFLKAGNMIKKQHSHSTILIPDEELTESNEGQMSESDWSQVTSFRIEWTPTEL